MATALNINQTRDNQFSISGDLDRHTLSDNWWTAKRKQGADAIEFDLAEVSKVDSAGLAWLINLVRDCKAAGVSVVFKNVPDRLLALAKLSDADGLLPLQ